MNIDPNDLQVIHNESEKRYEIDVGGDLAVVDYQQHEGVRVFTHTGVPQALEGQGIGSKLVKHVLEDAQGKGEKVIPLCPFIAAYIKRHPEYEPLVLERAAWRDYLPRRRA